MKSFLILLAALVGHFGIHLAIYNRLNAIGWPRRMTKRLTKLFFVSAVAIPVLVASTQWQTLVNVIVSTDATSNLSKLPAELVVYGWLCLASWVFLGIPWLIWRPCFGLEWVKGVRRSTEVVEVAKQVDTALALSRRCRIESKFPLNQLFDLSIDKIELPVPGLPAALDGYRIAQFSDIHLTGHIAPDYARYVVERATMASPNMVILSGDIIDSYECVAWLPGIFCGARANDGCYYVLGNHDLKIDDANETREAMNTNGWTDLGGRSITVETHGTTVRLLGNEHPWFDRPKDPLIDDEEFRILVSHSPDQIWWARRNGIHLMFAGHTHGGQGRLPLAGPLLSPSFHGSRFASGEFYKPPTTMHVSRGIGGTHLMRIWCRPQLSLLKLRCVSSE